MTQQTLVQRINEINEWIDINFPLTQESTDFQGNKFQNTEELNAWLDHQLEFISDSMGTNGDEV